jgi:tellurite resistance protein
MVDTHGFTDPERELLVGVPLAVFPVVAYADGSLSPAERRAFASIAEEVAATAERPQDALVRDVMGQISQDFDQIMDHLDLQMAAGLPART